MTSNPGTLPSSSVAARKRLWEPDRHVPLVPPPPLIEEETEAQRGVAMMEEGWGGAAQGFAASILLGKSLTSLGLSFPTAKGKKRVSQPLQSPLELSATQEPRASVLSLAPSYLPFTPARLCARISPHITCTSLSNP